MSEPTSGQLETAASRFIKAAALTYFHVKRLERILETQQKPANVSGRRRIRRKRGR